jgi:hypothetical protein
MFASNVFLSQTFMTTPRWTPFLWSPSSEKKYKILRHWRSSYLCLTNRRYRFNIGQSVSGNGRLKLFLLCIYNRLRQYRKYMYSEGTGLKSQWDFRLFLYLSEYRGRIPFWSAASLPFGWRIDLCTDGQMVPSKSLNCLSLMIIFPRHFTTYSVSSVSETASLNNLRVSLVLCSLVSGAVSEKWGTSWELCCDFVVSLIILML